MNETIRHLSLYNSSTYFFLQKGESFKNGNYLNVSMMYISTYIFSFWTLILQRFL